MTRADPSRGAERPTRRPDVEWATFDGEAVLYDPTANVLHRFNAGAVAVWAVCDGTASIDGITRAIVDAYSGPPGEIGRDVPAVIAQFRRLGLLLPSSVETGPC
jgi:coenzyme PQQ synthesis protein D (PqqD)